MSSSILALSDINGISLNVGLKERTERITDFAKIEAPDGSIRCQNRKISVVLLFSRQAAMKHPLLIFIPPIGGIIEGEDSLFDKVWVLMGEPCDTILPYR